MRKGDKIEMLMPLCDDEEWYEATVIEPLSAQFTCHRKGNRIQQFFHFYKDKGVSWRLQSQ
jgi:hypothetical protein